MQIGYLFKNDSGPFKMLFHELVYDKMEEVVLL